MELLSCAFVVKFGVRQLKAPSYHPSYLLYIWTTCGSTGN